MIVLNQDKEVDMQLGAKNGANNNSEAERGKLNINSTISTNPAFVLHGVMGFAHEYIYDPTILAHPVVTVKPNFSPIRSSASMPFSLNSEG